MIPLLLAACSPSPNDKELIEAAQKGDAARVRALIDLGANVNATALDGWRPLTMAADAGQIAVADILIARGADVNGKTGDLTPLFFAARRDHLDVVRLIIDRGGKLDLPSENRESFLEKVWTYDDPELTSLLAPFLGGAARPR